MAVYHNIVDAGWLSLLRAGATDVWDFTRDQYLRAGSFGASGVSITRASTGYAETEAGVLVPFASGALRRTDKGVLVEGARTNLLLRSQEFDNASWAKNANGTASAPAITADFGLAPDNTMTADRVQFNLGGGTTSGDRSLLTQSVTITNGVAHSVSVWMRSLSGSVNMGIGADAIAGHQPVTVTTSWQRFTFTATSTGTSATVFIHLRGGQTPTNSNTADILIWGAQLEAASFASSYIPTGGSTVTRAADEVSASLSGIAYPLSIFAEWQRVGGTDASSFYRVFSLNTFGNETTVYHRNTNNFIRLFQLNSGATQADLTLGTGDIGGIQKAAGSFGTDNIRGSLNGAAVASDLSATMPSSPTVATFGINANNQEQLDGYLRRAAIFSTALTDAQLQAITST